MKNYIKEALRTESLDHFKVDNPRLLHAAIGANTEIAELFLSEDGDVINVKEEMGDICWYVAVACDELEVSFDDLLVLADRATAELDPLKAMLFGASEALDVVKRALYYGVPLDEVKFLKCFGTMLLAVSFLAEDCSWTLDDLMQANVAKLSKRFPEKFTTEAAVNRDTDVEREALAG